MISISIHKNKRGTWQIRVMDSGENNEREILRSGAETPKQAAIWLLCNVNRLAVEVEERLIELGFLTEAECEEVLAAEPRLATNEETSRDAAAEVHLATNEETRLATNEETRLATNEETVPEGKESAP